MRRLPRPTYANVLATLSIFIALGGVSWAATQLPKNSVGTKQIKKNAVTTAKIKKNAVTTARIKKNAVNTSKIKGKAVKKGKVDPNLLASIDEDAQLKVYNGDGSLLGTLVGVLPSGLPIFQVLVDGGIYTYYPSGQLFPSSSLSPSFKNNSCDGTAYVESPAEISEQLISKLVGGPTRIVYRTTSGPNLGPISAWQFSSATESVVGQNMWERDETGACVPTTSSPFTGVLTALEPVPAPPDGTGPLTIG